ncbi:DUF4360 domain-containing protein [Zooshikella marina]|uniref:DUF4360 domain-containing protein n=1 Tax=Zooshikella ganghwensis TaxID=202772 RepID=UPI001BAF0051|nr:DUF4360 domain-containing protein [Zooshikella ganghwensis]MBU2706750.1 DUF4360 domain-containing protein [Zooshikella ganghwensis]
MSKLFFLLLVCLISINVFAVGNLQRFSHSEGCGYLSDDPDNPDYKEEVTSMEGPIKEESLRVYFNDLGVQTESRGVISRKCHLEAEIKVPKGHQFRAISGALDGYYYLIDQANGYARFDYTLDEIGSKAEVSKDLLGEGDFSILAQVDNLGFTTCVDYDRNVKVSGVINLMIKQESDGFSTIDIDEAGQGYQLSWNWNWRKCDFWRNQSFSSYYRAYNGRTYKATIKFDDTTGTFQSSAGFIGQFSNITVEDEGKTIKGTWQASDSGGWFKFKASNIYDPHGNFQGEWGDINGTQGEWWGYFKL